MTTKCIDTLHTEHLELLEFKQNSYSVTNCSINPLLHLHIAFPPQQYIVSNTYKLHKHSPLTPQYYRWHTSQTQSTHSPVLQVTHITNTIHSLPSITDDTHHKHSPLTPQYYRWHTSQTQSTHSPVLQMTHITNTVHSVPSMNDTSGRSHVCHSIWNAHVWKQHYRQHLGLRALVSCYMHKTNWMKGAWGNCSGSWGQ